MEIFLGSLFVFLLAGAGIALGQGFGRPPVQGRCHPGTADCGATACCRRLPVQGSAAPPRGDSR